MKRSQVNELMARADAFMHSQGFHLPPFAYWRAEEWRQKGPEAREIADCHLGWDITDFGKGDWSRWGLLLFTLRNGTPQNLQSRSGKLYAEKIMVVEAGQITPMHFHWNKMEDIINRGGGRLLFELHRSRPNGELDRESPVDLVVDGVQRTFAPGEILQLSPGESVTLTPGCYHSFRGEGRVLVGEVSLVNDDHHDNRFHEEIGRFPEIEEDEPPLYLLENDYRHYYRGDLA